MVNGIWASDPRGLNNGRGLSSVYALKFYKKYLKKPGRHFGRNVVNITIKMKAIVWKPQMMKIIKLHLRNPDNQFPPPVIYENRTISLCIIYIYFHLKNKLQSFSKTIVNENNIFLSLLGSRYHLSTDNRFTQSYPSKKENKKKLVSNHYLFRSFVISFNLSSL